MYTKINLLVGALALVVVSGASAYDHGTKATAMQNIEDRPSVAPEVTQSFGPTERHYDKPGMAFTNSGRDAELLRNESWSSVESSQGSYAQNGDLRTQRGVAQDVSFTRMGATERRVTTTQNTDQRRSSGGNKPSYYMSHNE